MRYTVFSRTYNRHRERSRVRITEFVAPFMPLAFDVLKLALAHGCPKGNDWSGIFEIQTDVGILFRTDGRPLAYPHHRERFQYLSWAQLEELDRLEAR